MAMGCLQTCIVPLVILVVLGNLAAGTVAAQTWGTLANPGFAGQPVKSVYFFAGDWRFPGLGFYDGLTPASNNCLYTIYPVDPRHLGWSEALANRQFAVNTMLAAGVNVVNMSYWGPAGDNSWAWFAPMQTAIGAHNELFDVAVGRPLLIVPVIEEVPSSKDSPLIPGCQNDFGPPGNSVGYQFKNDFPGTEANPAPGLVSRIEDLITRYLKNPAKPEWAEKWAMMYDRDGLPRLPRYIISILHVGSNILGGSSTPDATFAMGFDWVAKKVWQDTGGNNGGINVGFTLDVFPDMIPADSIDPNSPFFRATPQSTGPYLLQHPSVLAVQAFIPEIVTGICNNVLHPGADCDKVAGSPALDSLINWKRSFVQRWVATKLPVILDVSPGYDAHIVFDPKKFKSDERWGNNEPWRNNQSGFLSLGVVGLSGNTWNGYTEGYAIVPSCGVPGGPPGLPPCPAAPTPSDPTYNWFHDLKPPGGSPARLPTALSGIGPSSGAYSDAVSLTATLTEALTGAAISNRTVHFQLGSQGVNGVTDARGIATASITITQAPSVVPLPLVVSFAGDSDPSYLSLVSSSPFTITREPTVIRYTGNLAIANGLSATLAAVLADDDGRALSGKTLSFTLGTGSTAQNCSGVTDITGKASCQLNIISPVVGPQTISVNFAGDTYYEPASTRGSVVIFAYLPSGSFIVADTAAQAGAGVVFWSDIWSQVNKPGGGPAPSSFKGFADDVGGYPTRCGVNWKTTTGNSPPPPAGPLPSYMAVSVASTVNQIGPIATGNTQRIVVVQTAPGYAPDPSHPGTGTVVATVCGP